MTFRREWLPVLIVWAGAMLIAFRDPILSGFDLGFGDRADGIIEISLLEHWRNVLTGHAVWNSPIYFYPHRDTLGYNDGYFLFGLVYSFWRTWFDPFVSDTLNAATFKTIGFVGAWWLTRRTLRWPRKIALLVAALFTISNAMAVHAVHAQLQSIGLLPVAMILAIGVVRAEVGGRKWRAQIIAVTLALLMAAWLLTAYYMAWFTLWFALIFAASWLITTGQWRSAPLLALLRQHWLTAVIGGGVLVLAALPFLSVYLPKASESGGHGYWRMLGYLVTPIDLINVGSGNWLWGWVNAGSRALIDLFASDPAASGRIVGGEHESGFPLTLFVLTVAAAWRILRRRVPSDPVLYAFVAAVAVSWALTLQLYVASPWGAVFYLVPGAKGLRVVLRYQIFLTLPVLLLVAAVWRDRLMALLAERRAVAIGLIVVLLVEQLNSDSAAKLSREAYWRPLAAIAPPPAGCRSFYTVQTQRNEPLYRNAEMNGKHPHNDDAMLLAQIWRVPTINGYATFRPLDWDFLYPTAPDYDARAMRYANAHHLIGLCRLDVRDAQPWRKVS